MTEQHIDLGLTYRCVNNVLIRLIDIWIIWGGCWCWLIYESFGVVVGVDWYMNHLRWLLVLIDIWIIWGSCWCWLMYESRWWWSTCVFVMMAIFRWRMLKRWYQMWDVVLQVVDMPEHNPGQMGGTMRLGKRKTVFKTENSVIRKCAFGVHVALTLCWAQHGWFFTSCRADLEWLWTSREHTGSFAQLL